MKELQNWRLVEFQSAQIFGARLDGASVTKMATVNPEQQFTML